MTYKTTLITASVHNETDNPIFGESATNVSIEDEAGGPFIVLRQVADYTKEGEVRINDMVEFEHIFNAAKMLLEGFNKELSGKPL